MACGGGWMLGYLKAAIGCPSVTFRSSCGVGRCRCRSAQHKSRGSGWLDSLPPSLRSRYEVVLRSGTTVNSRRCNLRTRTPRNPIGPEGAEPLTAVNPSRIDFVLPLLFVVTPPAIHGRASRRAALPTSCHKSRSCQALSPGSNSAANPTMRDSAVQRGQPYG